MPNEHDRKIKVDVLEEPNFQMQWVRYELCDASLRRLQSQWSNAGIFIFDRLAAGTYVVRVTNTDNESQVQVVDLNDKKSYSATFSSPPSKLNSLELEIARKVDDLKTRDILPADIVINHNKFSIFPSAITHHLTLYRLVAGKWINAGPLFSRLKSQQADELVVEVPTGQFIHGLAVREMPRRRNNRFVLLPPGGVEVSFPSHGFNTSETKIDISIATKNTKADALGKLLANGDVSGANSLVRFENAERLMFGKSQDQAAAAIGGYYLLRFRQFAYLHDWTINLANWFPEMADGAIIHAWFELAQWQRNSLKGITPDFRTWLLKAEERGIPIFSEGMKLLYEGLTQLWLYTGKKDRQVLEARSRVEKHMARLVPGQLYTTFENYIPVDVEEREYVTS